ncbi:MAG: TolB family protein, partial [Gaiellaceae bacterium]
GDTTTSSAATTSVEGLPAPTEITPPGVSGDAREGETLTADSGQWDNAPSEYNYQWQRCDTSGDNCTDIDSENDPSYDATADDVGSTVRVQVTATTAGGDGSATSPPTPVVVAAGDSAVTAGSDKIVFSDGNDLYTADTSGENATRITDCKVDFYIDCGWRVPAISPDGQRIAASMGGLLAVMNTDGSDRRYLAYDRLSAPAWAPDGTTIAYATNDGTAGGTRIYTMDPNAENPSAKPLAAGPAYQTDPDYSPDGADIAYVGNTGSGAGSTLYVANADGTDPVPLDLGSLTPSRPKFSPDGSEIVFSVESFGQDPAAYAVDADGSNLHSLSSNSNAAVTTWTPDGSTVLYQVDRFICGPLSSDECDPVPGCPPALAARPGACHIWGMHPDGTDNHPLPIETPTGKSLDASYRKGTKPALKIGGDLRDGDYVDGVGTYVIQLSARDRGTGIKRLAITDDQSGTLADATQDCVSSCPIGLTKALTIAMPGLATGDHSLTIAATNRDGVSTTHVLNIVKPAASDTPDLLCQRAFARNPDGYVDFCLHGEAPLSAGADLSSLDAVATLPPWVSEGIGSTLNDLVVAAENDPAATYNSLGPEEKGVCLAVGLRKCNRFINDANKAYRLTELLFTGMRSNADNTKANAFQHSFWTALMLNDSRANPKDALLQALAHEERAYARKTDDAERRASRMDVINDRVGYDYANAHVGRNDEYMCRGMMTAVHHGSYIGPRADPYDWYEFFGHGQLVWRLIHDRTGRPGHPGVYVRFNGNNCATA